MDDWNVCQSKYLNGPGYQNTHDPFGEYCVGLAYLTGHFGQKDYALAVSWWSKAAAQGQAGAQVALGYSYEKGRGVPVNPAKAMEFYRAAAAQNSADGLFNLGRLYKDGIGVAANPAEANRNFRLAAEQGSEEARKELVQSGPARSAPAQSSFDEGERLYKAGNFAGAFQVFMQAASAGNLRAQLQVGSQYERGEGVAKNEAEAVRWYTKSATGGDAQAMKNLGLMYENGSGVRENWAEALNWYSKGAAKADRSGEFALGRMYEFGMGVPQSREKAIEWFRKAAGLGDTQAAYFARWLSDPTNNIGFRNQQEEQLVIANKLRFAGDLIGADPAGILFHNSAERTAWLADLRNRADTTEAQTRWRMQKSNYDSCRAQNGQSCYNPGPAPH
jgi:TPR repeat protein